MSKQSHELSAEDDALVSRVFDLLKAHARADPYGWDGALAQEIRQLPAGLRAMAATHHLDVSLTMDDIGWHFLNFGHPSHVNETELGLRELGLPDVADMFREAYVLVGPHLPEIRRPGGDYYAVIEQAGHAKRIDELTDQARTRLGDQGIYRQWAVYARQHPDRVFNAEPGAAPDGGPATRPGNSGAAEGPPSVS
jgi:hypothetical protein